MNYCKEKNVTPLIWYNSSTAWCDPTPLYRLNTPEVRDKEFEWLKEIGIQGVKIDFLCTCWKHRAVRSRCAIRDREEMGQSQGLCLSWCRW